MIQKKFRMSNLQKRIAILKLLSESKFPLSAYQMGTTLGFANGIPLENILIELTGEKAIIVYSEDFEGEAEVYFWLPGQIVPIPHFPKQVDFDKLIDNRTN